MYLLVPSCGAQGKDKHFSALKIIKKKKKGKCCFSSPHPCTLGGIFCSLVKCCSTGKNRRDQYLSRCLFSLDLLVCCTCSCHVFSANGTGLHWDEEKSRQKEEPAVWESRVAGLGHAWEAAARRALRNSACVGTGRVPGPC